MLRAAEVPRKGGLVAEAGKQRNLYQRLARPRKQVFGMLHPQLNKPLMDRHAKACPEAPREMTFRK